MTLKNKKVAFKNNQITHTCVSKCDHMGVFLENTLQKHIGISKNTDRIAFIFKKRKNNMSVVELLVATVGNQMLTADLNNLWFAFAASKYAESGLKKNIEKILEKRNHTKIFPEKKNQLKFEFHITRFMLHEVYYKHFKKNDVCSSDIMFHKATKTKWALEFCPMGHDAFWSMYNDEASVTLNLMSKSSTVDKITINKHILCKQNQIQFTFLNDIYDACSNKDWSQQRRYKINDLKKCKDLTFVVTIDFLEIRETGKAGCYNVLWAQLEQIMHICTQNKKKGENTCISSII